MGYLKFIITLAMLLRPFPIYAVEQILLIDRSGSMRSHFSSGLVPDLCHSVVSASAPEGNVTLIAFGTSRGKIRDCSQLEVSREDTLLDEAFEEAQANHPDIVWIITDNIQDSPRSAQAGNTEAFYEKLRGGAVAKVMVFPFLATAPNTQGLIAYAILLSDEHGGSFEKEVRAFLEQAQGKYKTEALQMRPLDRNTIHVSEPQIVNDGVPAGHKKVHRERDPIEEVVEIRFRSQFDHLVVKDATISPPESEWQAALNSPLILAGMQSTITPERITNLTSGGETEGYRVGVQTAPIKLKKDLRSLWTMAFAGSEETVTLDIRFIIQVLQGNFSFKDTFLQDYHAATEAEARRTGKVYGIATLPTQLATMRTDIPVHIPVKITVAYPSWPALLLVGVLLAALGAIGGLVWAAVTYGSTLLPGRGGWSVRAESSSGRSLPCELGRSNEIMVQGDSVGALRGNTFVVGEGSEGESGQKEFPLKGETTVKVHKGRTQIVLMFTPQKAWGGESVEEEIPVGRRR